MSTIQIIVAIYIAFLALLIVISNLITRHKRRFEVIFIYDVDYIFYEMAKHISAAKETIYDYENTLHLLYHDKERMFTNPVLSYEQQFPKIMENVDYLEKLLQKPVFADNFRKRVFANHETLQRIGKILSVTHIMTTFWTLGIAKLWTPTHT